MIVPTAAVFSDGAERFVFVEESQTKKTSEYRRKTVVVGTILAGSAELLAGDVFQVIGWWCKVVTNLRACFSVEY